MTNTKNSPNSQKAALAKQRKVLTRAMEWYSLNVKAGCTKHNFSNQSRRLWDACAAVAKKRKRK